MINFSGLQLHRHEARTKSDYKICTAHCSSLLSRPALPPESLGHIELVSADVDIKRTNNRKSIPVDSDRSILKVGFTARESVETELTAHSPWRSS